MNCLSILIVILLTSILPYNQCLFGEGLRGPPPCISFPSNKPPPQAHTTLFSRRHLRSPSRATSFERPLRIKYCFILDGLYI